MRNRWNRVMIDNLTYWVRSAVKPDPVKVVRRWVQTHIDDERWFR